MSLPSLPTHPDPHTYQWTKRELEAIQAYGQKCREQALLDAMNATLPFGKTGRVIAAAIGALK